MQTDMGSAQSHSSRSMPARSFWTATAICLLGALLAGGCSNGPSVTPVEARKSIDRGVIEYPPGYELKVFARNLTAPTAAAYIREGPDTGSLLVVENGVAGERAKLLLLKQDGMVTQIYPRPRRFPLNFIGNEGELYGPVGGMAVWQNHIYITHRDSAGMGVVSSIEFDGTRTTVVAELPACGDYGLTDIAVRPTDGRLFFGIGSATNSGVVGPDNAQVGWVKRHRNFSDMPLTDLKLLGYRFDAKNPDASFFSGQDISVTSPYQSFGMSNLLRIPKAANGKPTSAICSISPTGGDLRVEAHGIRLPRGLAFDNFNLYFTNNGMELRGTRPVKDDRDTLMRFSQGFWYGFPDFSADLYPINLPRFQPPSEMIASSGYPEVAYVIDHDASGLTSPASFRTSLVRAAFPSLSGAAKFDFGPASGPFSEFRGQAIVALSGDRAPFATSGKPLKSPVGYKVMIVDIDPEKRSSRDFIANTVGLPGSAIDVKHSPDTLERPIDIKFGGEDALFILDFGQMRVQDGRERVKGGTGKVYILTPVAKATP